MFGKPANPKDPFELGTGVEYYYDYAPDVEARQRVQLTGTNKPMT
jgi:hypothetical protein